jgi:hypothetical protein
MALSGGWDDCDAVGSSGGSGFVKIESGPGWSGRSGRSGRSILGGSFSPLLTVIASVSMRTAADLRSIEHARDLPYDAPLTALSRSKPDPAP